MKPHKQTSASSWEATGGTRVNSHSGMACKLVVFEETVRQLGHPKRYSSQGFETDHMQERNGSLRRRPSGGR